MTRSLLSVLQFLKTAIGRGQPHDRFEVFRVTNWTLMAAIVLLWSCPAAISANDGACSSSRHDKVARTF
jgi:hypothetical protein